MDINKMLKELENKVRIRTKEGIIDWHDETVKKKIKDFREHAEKFYGLQTICTLSDIMILAFIQLVACETRHDNGVQDEETILLEYTFGNIEIKPGSDSYSTFMYFHNPNLPDEDESMVVIMPIENCIIHLTEEEMQEAKDIMGIR